MRKHVFLVENDKNMEFAKRELTKQGWTDGCGLGKTESGIKEPVKVKIKNDTKGVGHDSGAEFTFHWWDHLFNKAASNIQVKHTEAGVEIENSTTTERKKKKAKTYDNKKMLYGQFVKGATLSGGKTTEEQIQPKATEDDVAKHVLIPENEEEIFKKCGGRTAHKGARHGLKSNGKLQRIEHQEQLLLDKLGYKLTNENKGQNSGHTFSQSKVRCQTDENSTNSFETLEVEIKHEKRKKKKQKDCENKEGIVIHDLKTEVEMPKVKKKKKKRKHEDFDIGQQNQGNCFGEENCTETTEKKKYDLNGNGNERKTPTVITNDEHLKTKKRKKSKKEKC